MEDLEVPVNLIWGENDPWEPIAEAANWTSTFPCIESMKTILQAGHCAHDEAPNEVNAILTQLIKDQQATYAST